MTHYRALAETRPDSFTVSCSVSLRTLTNLHGGAGDKKEALDAISEAIKVLTPMFEKDPPATAEQMAANLQLYRQLCQGLGREPNMDLVGIPTSILERLQ